MTKKIIVILLVFAFGFYFGKISFEQDASPASRNETETESREVRQGGYQFINPLLECEVSPNIKNTSLLEFKQTIKNEISSKTKNSQVNHISFYFRDLNNGPWFGINEEEKFSPASLLKVPLMMAYLKKAENNPSILMKMIPFEESANILETNVPKEQQLEKGKQYSVIELVNRMITLSDNTSLELLSKNIPSEEIEAIHRDLGIAVPSQETEEDFISVKEYASLFRVLFNASYLSREMSEKALEILSSTTFQEGIPAGVPENIVVSHKFGIREKRDSKDKQLHDCGIVYAGNKPYLICIMTRGREMERLSSSIKEISQTVYGEIAKK